MLCLPDAAVRLEGALTATTHAGGATTSLPRRNFTTTTNALARSNAATRIMRAAVYDPGAPQSTSVVDQAAPKLHKKGFCRGGVLCEVRSCGANPVDAKFVIGDKFPESWLPWASRRVAGSTPGFDFSGVVIDAPAGSGFAAGDEVFGFAEDPASLRPWRPLHGSFCEVVDAPLDQISHKPSTLSWQEAAACPLVCITALQALEQHGVSEGQKVLVIGASGGVGHVAVQIARCLGADVIGVCSGRNAEFVEKCGASVVVDYRQDGYIEKIAEHGPYDVVLDAVSSADSRDKAASYIERVKPYVKTDGDRHNYVVFGGATRHWFLAGLKRFTGLNCFGRGFELFWIRMPGSSKLLSRLAAWADAGKLRPTVAQTFGFDEAGVRGAFEALRSRRTAGKVVIDVSSSAA